MKDQQYVVGILFRDFVPCIDQPYPIVHIRGQHTKKKTFSSKLYVSLVFPSLF